MIKTKKSVKRASPTKSKKSPAKKVVSPAEKRANTNFQAKYYADRNAAFYNSASYSPPETYGVFKADLEEWNAVLAAAATVRHNRPAATVTLSKHVIIGGIPHKRVDGQYVPLVAAAQSKKWDIIEPKKSK